MYNDPEIGLQCHGMHVLSSRNVIAIIYFSVISEVRLATMTFDIGTTLSISYKTLSSFTSNSALKIYFGQYVNGRSYFVGQVSIYSRLGTPTTLPKKGGYIMSIEEGKSCLDPMVSSNTYNFVEPNYPFNNLLNLFQPVGA